MEEFYVQQLDKVEKEHRSCGQRRNETYSGLSEEHKEKVTTSVLTPQYKYKHKFFVFRKASVGDILLPATSSKHVKEVAIKLFESSLDDFNTIGETVECKCERLKNGDFKVESKSVKYCLVKFKFNMSQCKVWLDNYSGQYYPGGQIQGKVVLNFDSDTKLRGECPYHILNLQAKAKPLLTVVQKQKWAKEQCHPFGPYTAEY
ncbi:hypothetical protein NQ318_019091 [Aromia moschata]|uniref:Uncharacterized protein n=1 Tax=Aromia moschata TaxID=1265417 RepID=A0AAV8Y7P8_9CUCU|nr:hypothetical protein NQ318_019091 [Aromia moschata]